MSIGIATSDIEIEVIKKNMETLDCCAKKAAKALVESIKRAGIEEYKQFLNMMYHYTYRSEDNLLSAAKNSHTEELKEYFSQMAKEERGHYILAREDLKEFGLNVSDEIPEVVIIINKFWDTLSYNHVNGYLGLIYVFENVVPNMGDTIKQFVEKLDLIQKQARFLIVHSEADLDHGAEVKEFALKYNSEAPEIMVEAAEQACELFINLMREAFKPIQKSDL